MKKLIFLALICILCAMVLRAQSQTNGFSFQAVIRDMDGKAVANKTVPLEFSIINGKAQNVYSERQSPTTDAFGLISAIVGSGTPIGNQKNLENVDWSVTPFVLNVACDSDGNGSFEDLASGPILSGPFYNKNGLSGLDSIVGDGKFILVEKQKKDSVDYLIIKLDNTIISSYLIEQLQIRTAMIRDSMSKYFIALPANAQNGQVLKFNGNTWLAGTDLTSSGSGNTATSLPLTGDGSASFPVTLGQNNALQNQVLKWNGTTWIPSNDNNDTYNAGTGISISGNNQISNTGDTNAADDLTNSTAFSGDVSGPFNNLQLGSSVVGTPEIANNAVTRAKLAQDGASVGQVLKWNGASWVPSADNESSTSYSAGTGISINNNNQISNTGDTNAADDLTNTTTFSGDVSGPYDNLQLGSGVVGTPEIANNAITRAKLAQDGASVGQVLKWNGASWVPSSDNESSTSYSAGSGISINNNNQISNTGDTNAADDLTNTTTFSGDVSGPYNNLLLGSGVVGTPEIANNAITRAKLAQDGATDGQFLQYKSGVGWQPQTISSTGLPASTVFSGDVSGPYNNLQLGAGVVGNSELGSGAVTLDKISGTGAVAGDVIRRDKSGWVFSSLPGASGSASGDLSGTYPSPTVTGLRGLNIPSFPGADVGSVYWLQVNPTFGGTTLSWRTVPNVSALPYFTSDDVSNISSLTIRPLNDNQRNVGNATKRWGAVYAVNGTIQTSDKRYKKNISPLKLGLAQVLAMNPVYYNWKNEKDDEQKHLGFIAQDMIEIVPEVVKYEVEDGKDIYGMKYSEIIPVLVNAIKEQQQQIDALKKEIEYLKHE